jgi:hypothetical protein
VTFQCGQALMETRSPADGSRFLRTNRTLPASDERSVSGWLRSANDQEDWRLGDLVDRANCGSSKRSRNRGCSRHRLVRSGQCTA